MAELDLHADVAPGLQKLSDAGVRIVTLSNGTADVAESLLERAGLRELVEACLSVSAWGRWKPAAAAYIYAARWCGADPGDLALIAVHLGISTGRDARGCGPAGSRATAGRIHPSF